MQRNDTVKYLLILILGVVCLISTLDVHAQRSRDTSVADVIGVVDLHDDNFKSVRIGIRTEGSVYNQLEGFQASVKHGEIVLDYTLKDPKFRKEQLDHQYYTKIELYYGGNPLCVRPDMIFGDIDSLTKGSGERQVIISGLLENEIDLRDTLEIILTVEHSFDLGESILCSDGRPKWDFQQKVPFIMGAIGGAGLIGIGAALEFEAQDTYAEYEQATDRTMGDDLYNEANTTHKWAQGLMYAGAGIIAADVVWYFVRRKRVKRQQYLYDTYCSTAGVQLKPHFETGNIAAGNATNVGLTFKYTIR